MTGGNDMKAKTAGTANENQAVAKAGMPIRTSVKAGRIVTNVNRTVVARKKVRPGVMSRKRAAR